MYHFLYVVFSFNEQTDRDLRWEDLKEGERGRTQRPRTCTSKRGQWEANLMSKTYVTRLWLFKSQLNSEDVSESQREEIFFKVFLDRKN